MFKIFYLLGALHRGREVVDEVRVDLQNDGFAEVGHENITDFFLFVPISNSLGQGNSKNCMTL